jgi:hypothetical protein
MVAALPKLPGERSKERSIMKNHATRRDPRWIIGPAALLGVALMSLPALAQGTPEQRAACENDAMRLCQQYVPDVDRITACMSRHRAQLSPRCRAFFGGRRRSN